MTKLPGNWAKMRGKVILRKCPEVGDEATFVVRGTFGKYLPASNAFVFDIRVGEKIKSSDNEYNE